uniref:Putative homing endonuclease n=1 Tax=viral metagenome TaxID=1070528 RepID=A0A6M3LJK6_9ZZZZ
MEKYKHTTCDIDKYGRFKKATCTYKGNGACNKHLCSIWLIREYWGSDKLPSILAKECGIHYASLRTALVRRNIPRKDRGISGGRHPLYGKTGESSSAWKGGRISDEGRRADYVRNHGRTSYRSSARIIAESALGRTMKKTEIVHHINGDPSDDRNENLLVCDRKYHKFLHSRMWLLSKTGNKELLYPDFYVREYWDELKSIKQITEEYCIPEGAVLRYLVYYDIPRRLAYLR